MNRRLTSKRHSVRVDVSAKEKEARPAMKRISMEEGLAMEIMKHFDKEHIKRLKSAFYDMGEGDGISLDQFVCVMQAHLPKVQSEEEERAVVGNLCEFFDEMDINGDQSLEWDEFVEFVVATGTSKTAGVNADDMAQVEYRPSSIVDTSSHKHSIERVEYFSKMDKLVALERSNIVKIYEPQVCITHGKSYHVVCVCVRSLPPDMGLIIHAASCDRRGDGCTRRVRFLAVFSPFFFSVFENSLLYDMRMCAIGDHSTILHLS
eukprot:Opistho-2@68199